MNTAKLLAWVESEKAWMAETIQEHAGEATADIYENYRRLSGIESYLESRLAR